MRRPLAADSLTGPECPDGEAQSTYSWTWANHTAVLLCHPRGLRQVPKGNKRRCPRILHPAHAAPALWYTAMSIDVHPFCNYLFNVYIAREMCLRLSIGPEMGYF